MQIVAISPIVLFDSGHVKTDLKESNTTSVDTTTPNSYYLSTILNINPITDDTCAGWQTHCKEHTVRKKQYI